MKSINGKQTEYIEITVPDVKRATYILEDKLGIKKLQNNEWKHDSGL